MSSSCAAGVLHFAIPGDRRVWPGVAGRGQDLAHELVVRLVLVEAVADPVVKGEGRPLFDVEPPLVAQDRAHLLAK